jgi:hypothetical protein
MLASVDPVEGFENTLAGPSPNNTPQTYAPSHGYISVGSSAPQLTSLVDPELAITRQTTTSTHHISSDDPYALRGYKREEVSDDSTPASTSALTRRRGKKVKKYYNRQNALIDAYLGSHDEEQLEIEDTLKNGGKVKFAVNASFVVNFFLFIIQMYAAISTGSLSLFATAADAFVSTSG